MCAKEARRAHIEHSYIAEVAPRATLCEYNIIDVNFAILRAIYYEKLILKNRVPFFSPQSLVSLKLAFYANFRTVYSQSKVICETNSENAFTTDAAAIANAVRSFPFLLQ